MEDSCSYASVRWRVTALTGARSLGKEEHEGFGDLKRNAAQTAAGLNSAHCVHCGQML